MLLDFLYIYYPWQINRLSWYVLIFVQNYLPQVSYGGDKSSGPSVPGAPVRVSSTFIFIINSSFILLSFLFTSVLYYILTLSQSFSDHFFCVSQFSFILYNVLFSLHYFSCFSYILTYISACRFLVCIFLYQFIFVVFTLTIIFLMFYFFSFIASFPPFHPFVLFFIKYNKFSLLFWYSDFPTCPHFFPSLFWCFLVVLSSAFKNVYIFKFLSFIFSFLFLWGRGCLFAFRKVISKLVL